MQAWQLYNTSGKISWTEGQSLCLDIQPLAIKIIKEKATCESLTNIEAILVDSYNTEIQGSSVDLALLIDTLHMISNCDVLFREIHRLPKQDGLIFMDSGHMKMSRGRETVESTGLFTIVECRGHDMLVAPKAKQ